MLFSSVTFIFYFLPITVGCYYLVTSKIKNYCLLLFSIVFYAWGEPLYIILMLLSIAITYIFGCYISKYHEQFRGKLALVLTILINIGLLGFFKYTNFIIENVNKVMSLELKQMNIRLPLGISFYTFQLLSYVIDLYRGKIKRANNIFIFATYVTFFPQLIAGPIVRFSDVVCQLKDRTHTFVKVEAGLRRFIVGLCKKVLLANQLGEFCQVYSISEHKSYLFLVMSSIAFTMQIYYDFSGYSDMAIGLAKIFGFEISENFDYPFMAHSITEFWRKWHISLTTWFRDYVYIPLGGNRCHKIKAIRNLIIVWIMTGLWHGPKWSFVVWGFYFGIVIMVEKSFSIVNCNYKLLYLRKIYVYVMVVIGFVVFRSETLKQGFYEVKELFGFGNLIFLNDVTVYYLKSYFVVLLCAFLGLNSYIKDFYIVFQKRMNQRWLKYGYVEGVFLLFMFTVITGYLIDSSYNPFLYFRF